MDDKQSEESADPRRRMLAGLTPQQRYILYFVIALGVAIVLFVELSSR